MDDFHALAALIARLQQTPALDREEARKRNEQFRRAAIEWMLTEGVSYGVASNAPAHLTLPEDQFRSHIKATDALLGAQVETLNRHLDAWFSHGEFIPPYSAWRIAVILSKVKRKDLEFQFLREWCRHFVGISGRRYEMIDERARKIGAV